MKKILFSISALLLICVSAQAQLKVGDNPTTINSSALLEMESTTKGMLAPRMTTAQRDAITSPAEGLMIYNTTTLAYNYFAGGVWRSFNPTTFYSGDGNISGVGQRTVAQGLLNMRFTGEGYFEKLSGAAAKPSYFQIGRTAGEASLGVAGNTNDGLSGTVAGDTWLNAGANGNISIGTSGAKQLDLLTNNAKRLTITSTGNVGIGTANPTAPLTIANIPAAANTDNITYGLVTNAAGDIKKSAALDTRIVFDIPGGSTFNIINLPLVNANAPNFPSVVYASAEITVSVVNACGFVMTSKFFASGSPSNNTWGIYAINAGATSTNSANYGNNAVQNSTTSVTVNSGSAPTCNEGGGVITQPTSYSISHSTNGLIAIKNENGISRRFVINVKQLN